VVALRPWPCPHAGWLWGPMIRETECRNKREVEERPRHPMGWEARGGCKHHRGLSRARRVPVGVRAHPGRAVVGRRGPAGGSAPCVSAWRMARYLGRSSRIGCPSSLAGVGVLTRKSLVSTMGSYASYGRDIIPSLTPPALTTTLLDNNGWSPAGRLPRRGPARAVLKEQYVQGLLWFYQRSVCPGC